MAALGNALGDDVLRRAFADRRARERAATGDRRGAVYDRSVTASSPSGSTAVRTRPSTTSGCSGRLNRKPWALSQPGAGGCRAARSSPRPRRRPTGSSACASSMTALTIATSSELCGRPRTNERSIFRRRSGSGAGARATSSRCRSRRSRSARRAPSARASVAVDDSGSSHQDALGDLEAQAGGVDAASPRARRPPRRRVRLRRAGGAETFTLHDQRLAAPRATSCQRAAWRHASRAPTSPIGTMSPVSSASGMNSPGATRPRVGMLPAHQRLDADDAPGRRPTTSAGSADAELVALERLRAARSRRAAAPARAAASRRRTASSRPPPACLARYIAASASRIRSSPSCVGIGGDRDADARARRRRRRAAGGTAG